MAEKWIEKRKRDYYYALAKKKGFRSRAAFKLLQINRKHRIIKEGFRILDIGAAPGGWSQVACLLSGESGFVLAVDMVDMKPIEHCNFEFLKADIMQSGIIEKIKEASNGKCFNAVISDASPRISGVWSIDHALSCELVLKSYEIAKHLLAEKGNFLAKIFEGEEIRNVFNKIKKSFGFAKLYKPEASRKRSAEIYIVAKGFRKI